MNINWIKRYRNALLIAAVPVVIAGWWLFRPEKLFVNERVNEAAPFISTNQPQPVFTGKFDAGKAGTKGRATIYKSTDGKLELRLTDFVSTPGDDLHVGLAAPGESSQREDIGAVNPGQMEQRFDVPAGIDPTKTSEVIVFESKSNEVTATARLEPF